MGEEAQQLTRKKVLRNTLVLALFCLALGGWLLHTRIHSPLAEDENLIPFMSGIFSVFILPILFLFRKTIVFAYLANGFLIIIGIITMTHFSIVHFSGPLNLESLLYNTLLADILIALGKFVIGKAIFDLQFVHTDNDIVPKGRYFQYPNTGFWIVHFVALALVYGAGNILWK